MRNYSVASTEIYNINETGFMLGQGSTEQVVVPAGDQAAQFKAKPGTQESATVIKCIRSGGQVLLPLIITKGRIHTVGEHQRMEKHSSHVELLKDNQWLDKQQAGGTVGQEHL